MVRVANQQRVTLKEQEKASQRCRKWDKVDGGSRDVEMMSYGKERSVIRSEDDVGGRARVMTYEERVLRGGSTEMRLCRYGGWVIVRTL